MSPIKLVHRDIFEIFSDNRLGHFPYLNQVVFCCATDYPRFGLIPAEISDMIGVTTVHEQTKAISISEAIPKNIRLTVRAAHPPDHLVAAPLLRG